ncbi:MAG: hypothetical protein ACLRFL_03195 [Clostridia bacterium]
MKNKKEEDNKPKVNKKLIAVLAMFLGACILFGGIFVSSFIKPLGIVMICLGGIVAGISTMFF